MQADFYLTRSFHVISCCTRNDFLPEFEWIHRSWFTLFHTFIQFQKSRVSHLEQVPIIYLHRKLGVVSEDDHPIVQMLPSMLHSILIFTLNTIYSKIAKILTEWENYKTQEEFEVIYQHVLFVEKYSPKWIGQFVWFKLSIFRCQY